MGFLDIISTVANVATGISSIFGGGTGAAATAVATTAQAITRVAPATGVAVGTPVAAALGATQGIIVGTAPTGAGEVFTQTIIQRIRRSDNSVISQEVKKGSPWLMRSEVAALKKVTNAIRAADKKIPRKNGKVSDQQLQKAVVEDIQQLSLIQNLIGHHGGHHNGHP